MLERCAASRMRSGDEGGCVEALAQGESVLGAGAVSHSHLHFYECAMEVSLRRENWAEVERYAKALEAYTAEEQLPWANYYIERARALALYRQGNRTARMKAMLKSLQEAGRSTGIALGKKSIEEPLNDLA